MRSRNATFCTVRQSTRRRVCNSRNSNQDRPPACVAPGCWLQCAVLAEAWGRARRGAVDCRGRGRMVRGRSVLALPVGECLLAPVHASGRPQRPGLLAPGRGALGASRGIHAFGQPRLQRAPLSRHGEVASRERRCLHRRRSGAELQLHCGTAAGDGLHHRHPAREPRPPPSVQGAVRALDRSRGVRLASVLASPSGRSRVARHRRRNLRTVRQRRSVLRAAHEDRDARPPAPQNSARTAVDGGRYRVDRPCLAGLSTPTGRRSTTTGLAPWTPSVRPTGS